MQDLDQPQSMCHHVYACDTAEQEGVAVFEDLRRRDEDFRAICSALISNARTE
jgi:hypothetical protein